MKKKLFAVLLSIVMVAGLLPTVAFATENYNLYVNGEQFTSEKFSIACGEGTASYDPNTKTLTLNNAAITNGGKSLIAGSMPTIGISEYISRSSLIAQIGRAHV